MPFNFLHPFGFICRFPLVGLSKTSCLYAVSIYEFLLRPCAAQQLPACIWFQYLGFSCLSTTSCAHLVSISNFPGSAEPISLWHIGFPTSFPFCPLLLNFYSSHLCAPLGSIHLASISKLPPLVPLVNFLHSFAWSQDFTSGLLTTFCVQLNLVSMSKLPPLSLNNFLHSSGFNI